MIEKYNKKGFEILCLTAENSSDGKAKTESFIEKTGLIAPVGFLSKSDNNSLMASVGATGYPSSALVNPKGKIVWTGHPSRLNADIIEKNIGGARLGKGGSGISFDAELPKAYKSIVKGLGKGQVGSNLSKIEKALQNARTSDDDKSALVAIRDEVKGFFNTEMSSVKQAKTDGRYFDALKTLGVLVKHYKGHEMGKTAQLELKTIKSDKSLKNEIEVGKRLAKIKSQIGAGKKDAAKKSLHIIVGGSLKNTKEAKRAKKILSEL